MKEDLAYQVLSFRMLWFHTWSLCIWRTVTPYINFWGSIKQKVSGHKYVQSIVNVGEKTFRKTHPATCNFFTSKSSLGSGPQTYCAFKHIMIQCILRQTCTIPVVKSLTPRSQHTCKKKDMSRQRGYMCLRNFTCSWDSIKQTMISEAHTNNEIPSGNLMWLSKQNVTWALHFIMLSSNSIPMSPKSRHSLW